MIDYFILNMPHIDAHFFLFRLLLRPFGVSTSLSAEPEWKPAGKWEEKDFEGELKKLEKEAEENLDKKISELKSKIETTGSK